MATPPKTELTLTVKLLPTLSGSFSVVSPVPVLAK
jgi:hypothetical protein